MSEWTKLRSLRSTRGRSLAAFAVHDRRSPIAAAVSSSHHWPHMSPHDRADFHPLDVSLAGVQLAQLAIGVLGVLVITGEYSTGMIRATMTAVPKRLPVLWAKAIVFAPSCSRSLTAGGADRVLRRRSRSSPARTSTSRSPHPGVPRAVLGAALYLTVDRRCSRSASARSAQHGRRHRHLRRRDVRPAAADERAPAELERRRVAVPAAAGRRSDHAPAIAAPTRALDRASGSSAPTRRPRSRSRQCCFAAATSSLR